MIWKVIDIAGVVLWCFAVYVCVFDWEDVRDAETQRMMTEKCGEKKRGK